MPSQIIPSKAKFHESVMETMLALLLHPQVHLYLFSVGNNFSFSLSCLVKSKTPVFFDLNAGSRREQFLISKSFLPLKYATVPLSTKTHNSWFNILSAHFSAASHFNRRELLWFHEESPVGSYWLIEFTWVDLKCLLLASPKWIYQEEVVQSSSWAHICFFLGTGMTSQQLEPHSCRFIYGMAGLCHVYTWIIGVFF